MSLVNISKIASIATISRSIASGHTYNDAQMVDEASALGLWNTSYVSATSTYAITFDKPYDLAKVISGGGGGNFGLSYNAQVVLYDKDDAVIATLFSGEVNTGLVEYTNGGAGYKGVKKIVGTIQTGNGDCVSSSANILDMSCFANFYSYGGII